MSENKYTTYVSEDKRYGVVLKATHIQKMLDECKKNLPNETGGILIGRYNEKHNLALISKIIPSPSDSTAGRTWFHRGVNGIKSRLKKLWKENYYYLGEWHFHPYSSPKPSSTDISQIKKISKDKKYYCPEPILIIVGGNPKHNYSTLAYVFSSIDGKIKLSQIEH